MTIPLMPLIESIDNVHTTVFYWKPKFEDEKKKPKTKKQTHEQSRNIFWIIEEELIQLWYNNHIF